MASASVDACGAESARKYEQENKISTKLGAKKHGSVDPKLKPTIGPRF